VTWQPGQTKLTILKNFRGGVEDRFSLDLNKKYDFDNDRIFIIFGNS
jgi:hypothetical protein